MSLAVLREAWWSGLDAPGLNRRFRAGGVTVCRLMPMRAIPFEVVCRLGMNNGDCLRRRPRRATYFEPAPGLPCAAGGRAASAQRPSSLR